MVSSLAASVLLLPFVFVFVFVGADVAVVGFVSDISTWSTKWTCAVVDFDFCFAFDLNLVVMAEVDEVGIDSLPEGILVYFEFD